MKAHGDELLLIYEDGSEIKIASISGDIHGKEIRSADT